jgi:hypothetical protein
MMRVSKKCKIFAVLLDTSVSEVMKGILVLRHLAEALFKTTFKIVLMSV